MDYRIIDIKTRGAEGLGSLSFIEADRDVDFCFKRCYYIQGAPEKTHRGFHAHKTLKQLLFCPHGEINIVLDNGKERSEILLNHPAKGLLIYPGIWREMIWKQDGSVLCVLASDYYDESDYIRDYESFLSYTKGNTTDAN